MSDQKVLEKAIQKAIDGGWKHPNGWTYLPNWKGASIFMSVQFADDTGEVWHMPIESLIFSHQFAKALWGEQDSRADGGDYSPQAFVRQPLWKSRLQEMVVAENPIQYLKEHI